jgi:hypothetical protein
MKNKKTLELAQSLIDSYLEFSHKRYDKLRDHTYNSIYGDWDSKTFYYLRRLFFNLVTGEQDFDKFYDRFGTPSSADKSKPIAWGPRFLPDMISDVIWERGRKLESKVKEISNLYKKCLKIEKDFKKKKRSV